MTLNNPAPPQPNPGESVITGGYYGDTGTGKTFLARQHFIADLSKTKNPGIVIDSLGARNLSDLHRRYNVGCVNGAIDAIFKRGRHAIWIPDSLDDFEELCEVIRKAGLRGRHCVLFVDETSPWLSCHRQPEQFFLLLRGHRHNGTSIYLTTQYLGDLPPVALHCVHHHFIFRNSSPRAIDRLADSFPLLPTGAIQTLPDRQFIRIKT